MCCLHGPHVQTGAAYRTDWNACCHLTFKCKPSVVSRGGRPLQSRTVYYGVFMQCICLWCLSAMRLLMVALYNCCLECHDVMLRWCGAVLPAVQTS
jgi:hypothetical protein